MIIFGETYIIYVLNISTKYLRIIAAKITVNNKNSSTMRTLQRR